MNGKKSREKGKRWERRVAQDHRIAMPTADVSREGWKQAREGDEHPDVLADVFAIECKHGKRPSPRAALKQAQAATPPGYYAVAIIKDNNSTPFVVLSYSDWLELVGERWAYLQDERERTAVDWDAIYGNWVKVDGE